MTGRSSKYATIFQCDNYWICSTVFSVCASKYVDGTKTNSILASEHMTAWASATLICTAMKLEFLLKTDNIFSFPSVQGSCAESFGFRAYSIGRQFMKVYRLERRSIGDSMCASGGRLGPRVSSPPRTRPTTLLAEHYIKKTRSITQ